MVASLTQMLLGRWLLWRWPLGSCLPNWFDLTDWLSIGRTPNRVKRCSPGTHVTLWSGSRPALVELVESSVDGSGGRMGTPGGTTHAERGLRLAKLILSRAHGAGAGPGSRLPTERQLAMDLGVTRSSVRHALAMLEAQGHISREVGRGTFLRDVPPAAASPVPNARALRAAAPPTADAPAGPGADFAPADVMTVRRL